MNDKETLLEKLKRAEEISPLSHFLLIHFNLLNICISRVVIKMSLISIQMLKIDKRYRNNIINNLIAMHFTNHMLWF